MTRIVGGRFGGRRITVPGGRTGGGTRPTTDRVRESLFNVLAARHELDGAVVLDLYAGSGALGLEALSRGATQALFVESDRRAAAAITDNARALGASGVRVRQAPVAATVAGPALLVADLVFADPPYELPVGDVVVVLTDLARNGWLADGALTVVERSAAGPELTWPPGWTAWPVRRYGDTRLEPARWDAG